MVFLCGDRILKFMQELTFKSLTLEMSAEEFLFWYILAYFDGIFRKRSAQNYFF